MTEIPRLSKNKLAIASYCYLEESHVACYSAGRRIEQAVREQIAEELRKWWTFDDGQRHTHTWHDREDFIDGLRENRKECGIE